jgi:O-antigen ligase
MMKRPSFLLARIFFATTIILVPFRLRMTALSRPNPPVYGDYTDFLFFASDLSMLLTLIFWLPTLVLRRNKISFGPAHIWVPLLGLILAGWLSLANSLDGQLTIYHALRISALYLFFLFILNEIRWPEWVVIPVAFQLLIQSVVAIMQSLSQHDLGLQAFGEHKLDPVQLGTSVLESGSVRFLRAYGMSDHPNILGGCLALGLLILLAAFLRSRRSRAFAIALVFVPSSVALLLTFSRSAWIAFIFGSLLIMLGAGLQREINGLKRAAMLAFACLLAVGWFVARDWPYFAGRINVGDSFSTNRVEHGSMMERAFLFDMATGIFLDYPIVGVGLGVSVVAMREAYPVFPMSYQPPHFAILASALETGIIGAGFYLGLIFLPLIVFIRQRKHFLREPSSTAVLALFLALILIGFFDHYPWMLVPGRLLQWMVWGLWAASVDMSSS